MRLFRRPTFAVTLGWVAAALVATVAGLGAVHLVGESLTGTPGGVLTEEDVQRALAAGPTATSKMGPAPARTNPPVRGVEASFSTSGGTAIARCTGDQAFLVSWSPRPGYAVERVEQGPEHEVEVRFESDEGKSEMKISCSNGSPVAETKDD